MEALLHPRRLRPLARPATAEGVALKPATTPVASHGAVPDPLGGGPTAGGQMNASHSVRLRAKTLARLRSIAHDLEAPVSAVIKHAVAEAVQDARRNQCLAIPIRAQKPGKERGALDPNPQPVKLETDTETALRTLVAQSPLLNISAVIRGAVERFVENAIRDKEVVFRFANVSGSTPAASAAAKKPSRPRA